MAAAKQAKDSRWQIVLTPCQISPLKPGRSSRSSGTEYIYALFYKAHFLLSLIAPSLFGSGKFRIALFCTLQMISPAL